MEQTRERYKEWLHLCMAVIGGWFGTYCVLRFGHFASSVTLNSIEIFTGAALVRPSQMLHRVSAVALCAAGMFFGAWLPGRIKSDLRRWVILVDAAAAVLMCAVPAGREEHGLFFSLFAMSFQWTVFAGKQGYPCATIFSTNNLRQFIDAWVRVYLNGEEEHRPRMQIYGKTLLAFHTGVAAVCLLWYLNGGRWVILGALFPVALALLLRRRAPLWYSESVSRP